MKRSDDIMYQKSKRVKALLVSVVMAASSLGFSSLANLVVDAQGEIAQNYYSSSSNIGAILETADPDPNDPDTPLNQTSCNFLCKDGTDEWTTYTNTTCGPLDFLNTSGSPTTLQVHLKLDDEYYDDYVISQFSWYYGMSSTNSDYYWGVDYDTTNTTEVHPYSNEFDLVITIPSSAKADWENKFQFENCYTQIVNTEDKKTKVEAVDIVLVSITANGKIDTSEASDEVKDEYNATTVNAPQNSGGLWYSSALYDSSNTYSSFTDNGDGTATITTLSSVKIDDVDIVLTPGEDNSEDAYLALDSTLYNNETAIRDAGLPLNSHKFIYADFGLNTGVNTQTSTTLKSLSVTLSADNSDADVTRIMYGGGLNVQNESPADTEYAKYVVGLKEETDGIVPGYWYNDVGSDVYAQVLAYEEENSTSVFDITVESGSDLAKQSKGSYFTVTWDVPEEVQPYARTGNSDAISFQIWHIESTGDVESLNIESAVLTYEETSTFPYTSTASVSSSTKTDIGDSVEISYSDFNMDYEKITDVYAVQFDITTDVDVSQLLVGAGTSVVEKANLTDNWYQYDNQFSDGKLVLVNWEKSTVDSRPDSKDGSIEVAAYEAATGRKTYTFVWLMANGIKGRVATEQDSDHLAFGAYYGDLGTTQASSYTLSNVTVYYKADDETNTNKTDLMEGDLVVSPESVSLIEGTSSQAVLDASGEVTYDSDGNAVVGDEAIITTSVSGCNVSSSNAAVSAKVDTDGNIVLTAKDNSAGVTATITITTPGGQTTTVEVTVVDSEDPNQPEETTEETDATTTTTTQTTTTATTTSDDSGNTTTSGVGITLSSMYGDVTLDGNVNMADVIMLSKYIADQVDFAAQQITNADVYYDGNVDGNDSLTLLQFCVQLINKIGPEV